MRVLLSFSELYIELFTLKLRLTQQKHTFLIFSGGRAIVSPPPRRGGTASMPQSLKSRIFFFLLASCFLFLNFEASPNTSFDIELWSRQERDKKVCNRKGIWVINPCVPSELRGIKVTHNCTPYENGVQFLGIFHNSPVLNAGRVRKPVSLCMAC